MHSLWRMEVFALLAVHALGSRNPREAILSSLHREQSTSTSGNQDGQGYSNSVGPAWMKHTKWQGQRRATKLRFNPTVQGGSVGHLGLDKQAEAK